jgi:hypothetical protein
MKVLAFYPYRKGFVRGNTVQFPRDAMKSFEKTVAQVAEQSGVVRFLARDHDDKPIHCENHTCFTIRMENDEICSFMFTDSLMIMGNRVDVKDW